MNDNAALRLLYLGLPPIGEQEPTALPFSPEALAASPLALTAAGLATIPALFAAAWTERAGGGNRADTPDASPCAGAGAEADAIAAARSRGTDVILCDTAGRLHNKKNLMNELGKINKILENEYPDASKETLVVLDATTGQNALVQAKEFSDVAKISGIVLTKMDGTAKGGIAVAIQSELSVPVKYIGVGETIDDLQKFNPDEFVNALFKKDSSDEKEDEE